MSLTEIIGLRQKGWRPSGLRSGLPLLVLGLACGSLAASAEVTLPPLSASEAVMLPQSETSSDGTDRSLRELERRYQPSTSPTTSVQQRLNRLESQAKVQPQKGVSVEYRLSELYAIRQYQANAQNRQLAVKLYNQGVDAANIGNKAEAEKLYQQALQANPGMLQAANNLGVIYEAQQRLKEAATVYSQTIQAIPLEPILHRNLGVVYERLGRIQEALVEYEVYLTLSQKLDPPIEAIVNNAKANPALATESADYYRVVTEASNGQKLSWPFYLTPIRIYVALENPDQVLWAPLVKENAKKWEAVTDHRVKFKPVETMAMADIVIRLSPGPVQDAYEGVGHANYDVKFDNKNRMVALKVQVRINTGTPEDHLPIEEKQLLIGRHILHELGHAIGIWGHSTHPNDIMYTHPIVSELSSRDILTAQKLYDLTPKVAPLNATKVNAATKVSAY